MDVARRPTSRSPSCVDYVEATFRPLTAEKGLGFAVDGRPRTLPRHLHTDEQRLQQVLRNLLSNAVKFTESGEVALRDHAGRPRPVPDTRACDGRRRGDRLPVTDTGIGIPPDKLQDHLRGVPAGRRHHQPRYGGTGLGLSISREIARLLGGEIDVDIDGRPGLDVHAVPADVRPPGAPVRAAATPLGRTRAAARRC